MRLAIGSGIVCVASWLALMGGAGNVGLQRSISKGAASLVDYPYALVLVALTALVAAFVVTRLWRLRPKDVLIGELEPIHAPLVFAAVTVLGLQPAGALIGAWLATRSLAGPRSAAPSP